MASRCADTAIVYLDVAVSFDQLQKARITACREQQCFDVDFSSLQMPPPAGTSVSLPAARSVTIEQVQADLFSISIVWAPVAPAVDGDVYRVTIVDENGNNLTTVEEAATYSASPPTASGCVSACRTAVIDKRR
jgi:hypothetical protein